MFIKLSTLLLFFLLCFFGESVFADFVGKDLKGVLTKDGYEADYSLGEPENGSVEVIRNGYKKCTPTLCCPIHLICGKNYFCWNMAKPVHPMRKCSKV